MKRLPDKICVWCHKTYHPHRGTAGQKQRFCSRACEGASRAASRRGKQEPPAPVLDAVWLELADGDFTLIDAIDAPFLAQFAWSKGGKGYVTARVNGRNEKMHKLLMPGVGVVDHRNRNKLDNRRQNLRAATVAQNATNKRRQKNNTSGFKGVSWNESGKKWVSRIRINGVPVYLGSFATPEEAAEVYDKAAKQAHGLFAAPNDMLSKEIH